VTTQGLARPPGAVLGTMRIRKKLMLLHTLFSMGLAVILLVTIRPAITEVVERAEINEAQLVVRLALSPLLGAGQGIVSAERIAFIESTLGANSRVRIGRADSLGLSESTVRLARSQPGVPVPAYANGVEACAVALVPIEGPVSTGVGTTAASAETDSRPFIAAFIRIEEARKAVWRLFGLVTAALLAVYVLVVAALEGFVLPQNVYGPIARLLEADAATRLGRIDQELIPPEFIPADELGEITRSRNETIRALRGKEAQLAEALSTLEHVALDLKRKNHLLEAARRNLADADRLASLGMMSAGVAHELNTPLAVLKGLVDRLRTHPDHRATPEEAALMHRVVGRLERLGESLLDFARVRPPQRTLTPIRSIIEEALTLVRLDRDASAVEIHNRVSDAQVIGCDADRMVQVFVNLLRNAVEALMEQPYPPMAAAGSWSSGGWKPAIEITAESTVRDGSGWLSVIVADNGPGIDSEILARLFEPFASSRLDSHGTGLGLAVAEGIVREHGGLILARNRPAPATGAVFEVMVPRSPDSTMPSE
jgi:signal transduction histidine kinase